MANIQRWINAHGYSPTRLDLSAPRAESVYDHVSKELLSKLEYRIGTGGVHQLLSSIPRDEWDQAEQIVQNALSQQKSREGQLSA